MPRSGPRLRIREPPVHRATQGPPCYALRGATIAGVGIDHAGPSALGAQQHQRPGAGAQGRRPRPPLPPGPLPPQRRHPQIGLCLQGILSLERMVGVDMFSVWGFLAISLESCLINDYGICLDSPLLGHHGCHRRCTGLSRSVRWTEALEISGSLDDFMHLLPIIY